MRLPQALHFKHHTWDFRRPRILGVLNLTPDSFSDGGRLPSVELALGLAERMVSEGADALDLGGESTRPDATPVEAAEELDRVIPVLEALARRVSVPISIDTTRSEVAEAALSAGAEIVNDVGLRDTVLQLGAVAARHGAAYIAMHSRGSVGAMRSLTSYPKLVSEVTESLKNTAELLLRAGVSPGRIVLDPGVGFAKTAAQSLALLSGLAPLLGLGYAVCVGPSRKSFIAAQGAYAPLWDFAPCGPSERLGGTAAAVCACVLAGAHILRVHDVSVMAQAARVAQAIRDACVTEDPEEGTHGA